MALLPGHKTNFNTLAKAFDAGEAALMECQHATTGETVAVICAANRLPDGVIEFVPFATLLDGNPFELLNPPASGGRFIGPGEIGKSS